MRPAAEGTLPGNHEMHHWCCRAWQTLETRLRALASFLAEWLRQSRVRVSRAAGGGAAAYFDGRFDQGAQPAPKRPRLEEATKQVPYQFFSSYICWCLSL